MRMLIGVCLLMANTLLSACSGLGPSLEASITTYHNLPLQQPAIISATQVSTTVVAPAKKITFSIIPSSNIPNDLEFASHANQLSHILSSALLPGLVLTPAEDIQKADVVIVMNYVISTPKQSLASQPIYGQTGGGTSYHSGTMNSYGYGRSSFGSYTGSSYTVPTFGVVGTSTYTVTNYTRGLFINAYMFEGKNKSKTPVEVYQARLISTGSSGNLSAVVPALLQLFAQVFPGENGQTVNLSIPFNP